MTGPSTQPPRPQNACSAQGRSYGSGYQRLRISPGLSPSGLHWRCSITDAENIAADGFSIIHSAPEERIARYSSSAGSRYFDWPDASGLSARDLAVRFTQGFALIADKAAGQDWAYAGWFTDVLGRAEHGGPGDIPVFFADYPLDVPADRLPPPPPAQLRQGG